MENMKPVPLTDRQQRIYELEAEGLTNKQISEKVGISEHSVCNIRCSAAYRSNLPPLDMKKKFLKRIARDRATNHSIVIKKFEDNMIPLAEEMIRLGTEAESEETRRNAIKDSLAYAGLVPEKKVITQSYKLSSEDAKSISHALTYTETRVRGTDTED